MKRPFAALTVALALFAWLAPTALAEEEDQAGSYLALGDSVPFGFNPLVPPAQRGDPTKFVGYPEVFAASHGLSLANLSCPGETSASMIAPPPANPDLGCQTFRAKNKHLHYDYAGPQLAAAVNYLQTHPAVSLVSITIGRNDLALLQRVCNNVVACELAGLPALQQRLAANLTTILMAIRGTGYEGSLVAVNRYALDYRDATEVELVGAINRTLAMVTMRFDGDVANAFRAFREAGRHFDGDSCAARLLIVLSATPLNCDQHPSVVGRELLARTMGQALHDER
ncbi:MAG TPA: SGNH/GDSL hydrolase family protein [Candidatus Dormibacteraeota bacterium]|nr:SGNH/GDSL hydrolase family protein [Candidatus Dormibacteraeota bacterium]